MRTLKGKSVCGGVAIGIIHMHGNKVSTEKRKIDNAEEEIMRYENAKSEAINQLMQLYDKAVLELGKNNARIFEVQRMMLEDVGYNEAVYQIISEQMVNSEYAVAMTEDKFLQLFINLEDEHFRARAMDVKDVSERIISVLMNNESEFSLKTQGIIMAEELTPSQAVQFDKRMLLGIVTKHCSVNSHTAIVARTMNIPAITDVNISPDMEGKLAILDGELGTIIMEPDEKTIKMYQDKMEKEKERRKQLQQYRGKETVNKYGKKINLYANIGDISDLDAVSENDAEGIGLLRSEFLYLKEHDYPSEEKLYLTYKNIVEAMEGKKVIIRTIDIGADKQAKYFDLEKEENPAMGYRAIRICLTREDILKTQLRAILRVAVYGNVAVMFPMITSVWEIQRIKEIIEEVKMELATEDIACSDVEIGIMIETPAAVMISDLLAKEVDFFSIGTNDLTQYTLAIDRQNPKLDAFYNPHHESVLRMIRITVENGHKAGILVGICGELAADIALTDAFMDMGIDELSVTPSEILSVREKITK